MGRNVEIGIKSLLERFGNDSPIHYDHCEVKKVRPLPRLTKGPFKPSIGVEGFLEASPLFIERPKPDPIGVIDESSVKGKPSELDLVHGDNGILLVPPEIGVGKAYCA